MNQKEKGEERWKKKKDYRKGKDKYRKYRAGGEEKSGKTVIESRAQKRKNGLGRGGQRTTEKSCCQNERKRGGPTETENRKGENSGFALERNTK